MNPIFWSIAALDAILFIAIFIGAYMQGGTTSGGREMGMFFFGVVPAVVLILAIVLYVYSRTPFWRVLALLIVAVPGLLYAYTQGRNVYIDHVIAQHDLGRGYFSGRPLNDAGAAVVRGDIPALQKIAPTIDVNTVGDRGMTLSGLAMRETETADPEQRPMRLAMLQTLLALGAKPDPAFDSALKFNDPIFLQVLLDAGADPNQLGPYGQPAVFSWLAVMPMANLQLLIDRGLNLNATAYGTPLAFELMLNRRWDLVILLIERGADIALPRDDGRTVAGEIAPQIEQLKSEGKALPPDLLRLRALIDTPAAIKSSEAE